MKDQSQGDRALRKSHRQRVPNSFYTEGINQLKKQPRNPREVAKPARKRSKVYMESQEVSYLNDCFEQKSQNKDSGAWYPCKLPKNGQTVKVQFVLNVPSSDSAPIKKPDPPPKAPKKQQKKDASTDLLSLFQKAIENVNDDEPGSRPADHQFVRSRPSQVIKQQRAEDPEGRILSLERTADKLVLNHSKLGQVQIQMQGSEQSEEEQIDLEMVQQYRQKIQSNPVFSQLSLFN